MEIEWLSIDEYHMNIHINHFESSSLRGLESWQPARDPEGTWVEAMEEWLVEFMEV